MGHIGGFMAVCQTVDVLDRKPMSVYVRESKGLCLEGQVKSDVVHKVV